MTGLQAFDAVHYVDRTGYATHLQLEFAEYIRGSLSSSAFTIPVHSGEAILEGPGLVEVYQIWAQPIISRSPGKIELLGPPLSFRAPDGRVLAHAELMTAGNLIRETVVHSAELVPCSPQLRESDSQFRVMEVSFGQFDYHDHINEAEVVLVEVSGVENGQSGEFQFVLPVVQNEAKLVDPALTDITRLEFTPFSSANMSAGSQIGNKVIEHAARGLYLTEVDAETTGTKANPVNSATSQQGQPIPPAVLVAETLQEIVMHPSPPAEEAASDTISRERIPTS